MVGGIAPGDPDVLAGIADVARRHLNWHGAISREMPLLETFDLDSLRQLTLVVEIEDRFRIRLDDRDEESITTVGDLVDTIRRKLAGSAATDAH
jgi:acyl carrier protein